MIKTVVTMVMEENLLQDELSRVSNGKKNLNLRYFYISAVQEYIEYVFFNERIYSFYFDNRVVFLFG
jgi:hypothetical protein